MLRKGPPVSSLCHLYLIVFLETAVPSNSMNNQQMFEDELRPRGGLSVDLKVEMILALWVRHLN